MTVLECLMQIFSHFHCYIMCAYRTCLYVQLILTMNLEFRYSLSVLSLRAGFLGIEKLSVQSVISTFNDRDIIFYYLVFSFIIVLISNIGRIFYFFEKHSFLDLKSFFLQHQLSSFYIILHHFTSFYHFKMNKVKCHCRIFI